MGYLRILAITLCLFCTHAVQAAEITRASVAQTEDGWQLDWQSAGPVDIYVSGDVNLDGKTPVGQNLLAKSITVAVPSAMTRPYFELKTPTQSMTIAERLLPLEGGRNFRDLGGYSTADGKRVRWGKLFRSGYMYGLTDNDYDYLSALGIQVVCDLRSIPERNSEPTNWRTNPAARYVSWNYDNPSSGLGSLFTEGTPSAAKTREFMLNTYGDIVYDQQERYAVIFKELAAGNIPLAFNCSAGKDRAGMAAALILTALGVERDQIIHDYALSETFVDYMAAFTSEDVDPDSPYAFLSQLPPEVLAPMMRSDPDYLRAAFTTLEHDHGSVMNFIVSELGVSEADLRSIRSKLLE